MKIILEKRAFILVADRDDPHSVSSVGSTRKVVISDDGEWPKTFVTEKSASRPRVCYASRQVKEARISVEIEWED